jgi:site-specific DNA recombinase
MSAIEEYCKSKNYTLVGSYPDEAKSATNDQRPQFQQMMVDSEKNLFEVVVVHKLDRLARDRYDSAHYKRLLKNNGVRLDSVLEQLDGSPESVILESVLEGMAEYFSKNLSREARKGMLENAKNAMHAGGRPPYGLKITDDMKYIIDEERYRAVQIYFQGIAEGMSLKQIACTLNEQGFRTQTGKKFTPNSFYDWAGNRKYRGDYTWDVSSKKTDEGRRNNHIKKPINQQTVIPNAIAAIIEPELWDKVQRVIGERKHKPGAMKAKVCYLLSSKIICGKCGSPYSGNTYTNSKSKDKTILSYYKCSGKCGNANLRKLQIEQEIITSVQESCLSEEAVQECLQYAANQYKEHLNKSGAMKSNLENRIKSLETSIGNWIEALGKGIKGLKDKIIDAQDRVESLQCELHKINSLDQTNCLTAEHTQMFNEKKKRLLNSANEADKKQALQYYVVQLIIKPGADINLFHADLTCRVLSGGGEGI